MTDPKEFNSLDELFRKTFEDLPETPAPSGWDNPSPRVWDEVRVRLKPPRGGWSAKALTLVSGLAVVLLLCLYWMLSRPEQPAENAPETTEQSASIESTGVTQQEKADISSGDKSEKQAPPVIATPQPGRRTAPKTVTTQQEVQAIPALIPMEHPAERQPGPALPSGSAPLPGSRPASPNTTVLRQAEAWRSAPWAKPLAPLPTVLEMQLIRPVPQGLKDIGRSGL